MDRKNDDQKVRTAPYKPTMVLEVDLYIYTPIDNGFGYTMGMMATLFDKKTGLICVMPSDIVNEILEYLFWRCLICNGPVAVRNTACSQLCILGNHMGEDDEDDI